MQSVFGLPGSKPLSRKVEDTADAVRTIGGKPVVRAYAETKLCSAERLAPVMAGPGHGEICPAGPLACSTATLVP